MKLSIIIPIYNVEQYIEKCLCSCFRQNVNEYDYEVIIVNDGSPDNSVEIAKKIIYGRSNSCIINQPNLGLSEARNTGLKKAKGEYIWFVDSDDWIEENCLGGIIDALSSNPDYLQLQHRLVYNDKTAIDNKILCWEGRKSGVEIIKQHLFSVPAQFAIYKRSFLTDNHINFYPNIFYEDVEIKFRLLYQAKVCVSHVPVVYNYYQRTTGNIKSNFRLKHAEDAITVMRNLLEYSRNPEYSCESIRFIYAFYIAECMNILNNGLCNLSKEQQENIFNRINSDRRLYKIMLKSPKLGHKFEAVLGFIDARCAVSFYSLSKVIRNKLK